jgi:hypothetical protein
MFNLLGLDTSPDDFHKKDGSSPYLRNVRFMGEREPEQRAQVMCRKGAALLATVGEGEAHYTEDQADNYLELRQGRAIQYELLHNKRLTGLSLWLYNQDRANGYIKITIRDYDTQTELSNAVINTADISRKRYSRHTVHFIHTIVDTRVRVRLEILDDVDDGGAQQRAVRVLSRNGSHQVADYDLPNDDASLHEVPYDFRHGNTAPMTGTLINDWQALPRSKEFVSGGKKYIAVPVRHHGELDIFKYDVVNQSLSLLTTRVDNHASAVRFAQGGGYLFYVDGSSALRRVNLTTLQTEDALPKSSEITVKGVKPKTLSAKPGASLIHYLHNRIYLGGFRDDPNLILVSLIDKQGPKFDQFNDRFYSPDQSPQLSAGNPITAFADISDYLVIFRRNDLSLFDVGAGFAVGDTQQKTPEGASLGVLNQEAVCQGKNNIYFFNPVEGVQRFGGSVNRTVSLGIDNLIRSISHKDKIFMVYQNDRVHMFFSFDGTSPDSRLYYYAQLEGKLPWYLDNNTPVSSAVVFHNSEKIYAVHSETATVMDLDAQFRDFDSYIAMEYDTQYRIPPTGDPDGWLYVRRLHVHEIANSRHSFYAALDIDHQDKPLVWRRYVGTDNHDTANPDAVFSHAAEPGSTVFSIPMYVKCRRYQVRIKRYCYKDVSEVLGLAVEYDTREAL